MRSLVVLAGLLWVIVWPVSVQAGPSIAHPRERTLLADRSDSTEVLRPELGFLLGTPGAVNLELGWWPVSRWGFRASGMYYGVAGSGVQASVCRTLQRARRTRTALALVAGSMHLDRDAWNYAGTAIDLNLSSLFVEGGFVYWSGDDRFSGRRSGPGVVFQLGVVNGGGIRGPR